MKSFLDHAFTMPTAVFGVLLLVVVAYWLLRWLTGLDLPGSWLEGAESAVEAGLDGAVASGSAIEPGDGASGHGRGWVKLLGFGEVPLVLVLSLLVLFGWISSYLGSLLASRVAALAAGGIGVVLLVALGSVTMALLLTMIAVTPLRRLMRFVPATEHRQLVGQSARVTTQRVDERFGQAEVADPNGAPILIQARAPIPNGIRRGDLVRVVSYDPRQEVFEVAPAPGSSAAPAPARVPLAKPQSR